MEAETIAASTTSGEKGAIAPENTAGADTSKVPNYRKGKAAKPLGSAQERIEILAQEIVNARRAGIEIEAKPYIRVQDGVPVIQIRIAGVWKCQTCGWWNIVPNKCQNEMCQTSAKQPEPGL